MNNQPLPKSIYEPSGPAKEYAPLACNLYGNAEGKKGGCSHRCAYCYCAGALHMPREQFFCDPKPRPRILESLERSADKMVADNDRRRVLFSFIGDPFCALPSENDVTRKALQIMVDRGLRFEVCTKGGLRAERDLDLLQRGGALGTSLVWVSNEALRELEPQTSCAEHRVELMSNAHELGIPTWVSVEPVIDPYEAIDAISWVYLWADEIRVGKINPRTIHQLPVEWQERVRRVDWQAFVDECYDLLLGTGRRFMLKESLHPYLRGRSATGGPTT